MLYTTTSIVPLPYGQVGEVLKTVGGKAWIGGGSARAYQRMNAGLWYPEPSDIDLFLYKAKSFDFVCALLKEVGYEEDIFQPTPNARSFYRSDPVTGTKLEDYLPVQVVSPVASSSKRVGTPEEVLATFGFTTEQFALEFVQTVAITEPRPRSAMRVVHTRMAEWQTTQKEVRINHLDDDPIGMAVRMIKYAKKGYSVSRSEMQKLFDRFADMSPSERTRSRENLLAEYGE